MEMYDHCGIWLEVKNARFQRGRAKCGDERKEDSVEVPPDYGDGATEAKGKKVYLQLKAEKADYGPRWWELVLEEADNVSKDYQGIVNALGKNHQVLAMLGCCPSGGSKLAVLEYRIQYE